MQKREINFGAISFFHQKLKYVNKNRMFFIMGNFIRTNAAEDDVNFLFVVQILRRNEIL